MQCQYAYLLPNDKYVYCNVETRPHGNTLDDTTPSMCLYQEFPPERGGNKLNTPNWASCYKLQQAIDRQKTVLVADWAADETYIDYPYRAAIPVAGATIDMFPYVEFQQNESESGNYADVSLSYDGGVYIYAKVIPSNDITVSVYLYEELYEEPGT